MSYSNNPLLPKARKYAVELVIKEGLPVGIAAHKAGIHRSTLWRWVKRWQDIKTRMWSLLITTGPIESAVSNLAFYSVNG